MPGEAQRVEHDFECTAVGENGYYFWRCKGCGTTVPYPSPAECFPKGKCQNFLRRPAAVEESTGTPRKKAAMSQVTEDRAEREDAGRSSRSWAMTEERSRADYIKRVGEQIAIGNVDILSALCACYENGRYASRLSTRREVAAEIADWLESDLPLEISEPADAAKLIREKYGVGAAALEKTE